MRALSPAITVPAVISIVLLSLPSSSLAVEPGVDIAAPRVVISQVGDFIGFQPANLVVEQGDYVLWKHVGATLLHTTTSGSPCVGNGLWNLSLGPGAQVSRRFLEAPQTLPYFCSPHCGLGMTGQIRVTSPIALQASGDLGAIDLSWSGGGGTYQVYRSDTPGFVSAATVTFAPTAGDTGTAFSDATLPALGGVLFYLATNKP